MPFTPVYTCGFEVGTADGLVPAGNQLRATVHTDAAHTGSYGVRLENIGQWKIVWATGGSVVDIGVWVDATATDATDDQRILVELSDGQTTGIWYDSSLWHAYRGGTQVDTGTIATSYDEWAFIEMRVSIDNATGYINTRIDGTEDITFTGDTQPSDSATISKIFFRGIRGASVYTYYDDITLGTGGWPGDRRYDPLLLNGDTGTINWTRSAGATNYENVDEVPASDTDYVYTTTDNLRDLYTLADWTATGKNPLTVTGFWRAKKSEAGTHRIYGVMSDGVNTVVSGALDLLTSLSYVQWVRELAPDSGAWTDADIDALQIGQDSDIN